MCQIASFGVVKVMSPIKSLKQVRQEVGVSQHIPITHFNSPTLLETQSGALFSVIQLQGVPFETEKNETINTLHRQWHRALTVLDERFALLGTLHRRKVHCQLTGQFNNSFARQIDEAYQKQFAQQSLYVNDLYLTLILKGLTTQKIGWISNWLPVLNRHAIKKARQSIRQANSKVLEDRVTQFITLLAPFKPRILGKHDLSSEFSELLAYLSLWVNGGQALALRKQQTAPPFAKSFVKAHQAQLRYPRGNLAHYLSAQRLFFGQAIQFQGSLAEQTRFAAMVSLKRYGSETASIMLDPLLHLDSELISTQSFLFESKAQADKTMERHARKLQNANDPAYRQIEALTDARDQVASDEMAMGYHHNTIMLLNHSLQGLNQAIAQTIQCYANAGMVAVRETLGQEAAFWAQIPGNFKYIARSSLISSKNFADFFPLHNYRSGYKDGNHLGGAMMLVETLSRTPLWLNLHAKGPKENPSSGHTTIIGEMAREKPS